MIDHTKTKQNIERKKWEVKEERKPKWVKKHVINKSIGKNLIGKIKITYRNWIMKDGLLPFREYCQIGVKDWKHNNT